MASFSPPHGGGTFLMAPMDPRVRCLSAGGCLVLSGLVCGLSFVEVKAAHAHALAGSALRVARKAPCDGSWRTQGLVYLFDCEVHVPPASFAFKGFQTVLPEMHVAWASLRVQRLLKAQQTRWEDIKDFEYSFGVNQSKQVIPGVRAGSYGLSNEVTAAIPAEAVSFKMPAWQQRGLDCQGCCSDGVVLSAATMRLQDGVLYDCSYSYRVLLEVGNASAVSVLGFVSTARPDSLAELRPWNAPHLDEHLAVVRPGAVALRDMMEPYLVGLDAVDFLYRCFLVVTFIPALLCMLWPHVVLLLFRDVDQHDSRAFFRVRDDPSATWCSGAERELAVPASRAALLALAVASLVVAVTWLGPRMGRARGSLTVAAVLAALGVFERLRPEFFRGVDTGSEAQELQQLGHGGEDLDLVECVEEGPGEERGREALSAERGREALPAQEAGCYEDCRTEGPAVLCILLAALVPTAFILGVALYVARAQKNMHEGMVT